MNKKGKKFYIRWALVILWMAIIFNFSSDPAKISDGKSGTVISIFNYIGLDLNSMLGNLTNFIVRKMGHFTEFLVLYILLYKALELNFNKKKSLVIALIATFMYACSDEFHQTFVQGRDGKFKDVLIDTSGGIAGFIYFYIRNLFR